MKTNKPRSLKWPAHELLRAARERTKAFATDNEARTREMLAQLLEQAGWEEQEFLEALVHDVAPRKASGTHRRSDLLGTGGNTLPEDQGHPRHTVGRARRG